MSELRKRMTEDMQLRGISARTQESYISAVKGLVRFYNRSPDLLSEEEIRNFFLHLINEREAARSTVKGVEGDSILRGISCMQMELVYGRRRMGRFPPRLDNGKYCTEEG